MSEQAQTPKVTPQEAPATPEVVVNNDWKSQLPDYAKNWQEVQNANTFDDFMGWVDAARSYQGRSVALPGEDASPEQRAEVAAKLMQKMPDLVMKPRNDEERSAFYDALGRPSEAAQYQVEVEGAEQFADRINAVKEAAYQAGLSQEQFNALFGQMIGQEKAQMEQMQAARETSIGELKAEWGAAFDRKVEDVHKFLEHMGAPKTILDAAKGGRFGAEDYKWFADLADRTVGEGNPQAGHGSHRSELTPAEVHAKMAEIRGNQTHPFNNPSAPGHQEAVQQMLQLARMLPGGSNPVTAQAFGVPIT